MPKYKDKKEFIIIEAIQFLGDDYSNLCGIGSMGLKPMVRYNPLRLEIPTLEGTMIANVGDWIIKGVNGEFYPCKPDIFKKFYEKLNN